METELANTMELTENKALRDRCIDRLDVLDKVKELLLLPGLEMMTARQVADFYEVDYSTFKSVYKRNKDEIDSDGTQFMSLSDVANGAKCTIKKNYNGCAEMEISDNISVIIPNRGIRCFTKRAILRIGMLLRDSEVAKEVRTQLLNIEEHASTGLKVMELETEQSLALDFLNALGSEDMDSIQTSASRFLSYYKRHINVLTERNEKLTATNSALVGDVSQWRPRQVVNRLIRSYAQRCCSGKYGIAYDNFYQELYYKYGIALKARAVKRNKKNCLDTVEHDEWPDLLRTAVAMCEEVGIATGDILSEANQRLIWGEGNEMERV